MKPIMTQLLSKIASLLSDLPCCLIISLSHKCARQCKRARDKVSPVTTRLTCLIGLFTDLDRFGVIAQHHCYDAQCCERIGCGKGWRGDLKGFEDGLTSFKNRPGIIDLSKPQIEPAKIDKDDCEGILLLL